MNTKLFFLPFLSLIVVAVFAALESSFTGYPWLFETGLALGTLLLAGWAYLDRQGFAWAFSGKGSKLGLSSGLVVVFGILFFVGLGFVSTKPRFNKSYDATKAKTNTLSEQSIKIVQELQEAGKKVEVTAFFMDEKQKEDFRSLAALYGGAADAMNIRYIDPRKDPMLARQENLTSENTAIFRLGSQETRITAFTEEKITNALVKAKKEKEKKVYFLTGNGEPDPEGQEGPEYGLITQELKNNKFAVEKVALVEKGKVPDDADMIVAMGITYDLKALEIPMIQTYLDKGGAMLIAVDAMTPADQANQLLSQYGLTFGNDLVIFNPQDPRAQIFGGLLAIFGEFDATHPVTKDFARRGRVDLLVPNTRTVAVNSSPSKSVKAETVGHASKELLRVKDVRTNKDLGSKIANDRIEMGVAQSVLAVASGKIGEKETRIVAIGSGQVFANGLAQDGRPAKDLAMNIFNYLGHDEDLIAISAKDTAKGTLDVSGQGALFSLFIICFIYPLVLSGGGLLTWFLRRNA